MDDTNWIYTYYQDIRSGRAVVGKWIRLLYEYIIKGFEEKLFYFDLKKANDAIGWMEKHCFHTIGALAPQPLKFETWQKALISCVYGIVDEKGNRQFREVVFLVARKNGKTKVASCAGDYEFQKDGGYGARIYCVAPKLDQADLAYSDIWQMIELDPEYQDLKRQYEERDSRGMKVQDDSDLPKRRITDLRIEAINSKVKKIAFSAKKSDGFNPIMVICDEVSAWEGDAGLKQYNVMKSGMGAQLNALMFTCTTAGYINDSIYDDLLKRSTRFLLGDSNERHLLPILYMIDDVNKWNDINELRKSNPNLGVSVYASFLIDEIAVAEQSLSAKAEFLTKYCNIKQNSSLAWLGSNVIEKACGDPLQLEDFRGCYCVGGFDLSRTTDLTFAIIVIEKNEELYVFGKGFMPEERIDEAQQVDGVPYRIYEKRGLLQASGTNIIDYNDVFDWFRMMVEQYEILPLQVGYDKYSANYLVQQMAAYGFHMDDVYQGYNLHPVIQETEGLLKDGRIHIGDNDLLKVHFFNSALKVSSEKAKSKLVKIKPTAHIDGMAAFLDAMTVRQKWYAEIGAQLKNARD